jgi:uncharacterized membrane protein YfcA
MELFGYFGALCIGLILGLTGGGGSILTVPILVYVMLIDPIIATAYSLFIVGTTSAFGAVQNYRKGLVDIKNGFLFAIPSFVAVYITRRFLVPLIPDTIVDQPFLLTKSTFLMVFFAVIMVLAAISMLKKKKEVVETAGNIAISTLLFQTFTIGIIIGLVGAGGGFLIIPSLVLFAKLPMKKAVGTSLFIIAMNSLIGFLGDVQTITIDWKFLSSFTGISIIGIFIGIYLNKYVNESQLKKGFAYFVLFMASFILVKELAL